jgi:hypothetical protein
VARAILPSAPNTPSSEKPLLRNTEEENIMGMDVHGLNPDNPKGQYFSANLSLWPEIHAKIVECCSDLFDKETLIAMKFNDGAGAKDRETCLEMANRFEALLQRYASTPVIEQPDSAKLEDSQIFSQQELNPNSDSIGQRPENAKDPSQMMESFFRHLAQIPGLDWLKPYDDMNDALQKWIDFLRHCGGFAVW